MLSRLTALFILCSFIALPLFAQEEYYVDESQKNDFLIEEAYLKLIALADDAKFDGELDEARLLFDKAVKSRPDASLAWFGRGRLFEYQRQYPEAESDYLQAISIQPELADARFALAQFYYKEERFLEAIPHFEFLLDHPVKETNAVYFRSRALTKSRSAEFDGVSAINSQEPEICGQLGLSHMHIGNHAESLQVFTDALEKYPSNSDLQINKGQLFERIQNYSEAIQCYRSALNVDPTNEIALYNLSLLSAKTSEVEQEEIYEAIVSAAPNLAYSWSNLGFIKFNNAHYADALEAYREAIVIDPRNPEYHLFAGICSIRLRAYDEAIKLLEVAKKLSPKDDRVFKNLGNVYFKKRSYEKALVQYARAAELNPSDQELYYNRGMTFLNLKSKNEACIDLQKAADLGHSSALKQFKKQCSIN